MSDQQEPPKRRHRFRNFVVFPVLGLFALIVIVSAIAGGGSSDAPPPATPVPSNPVEPVAPPKPQPPSSPVAKVEVFGDGGEVSLGVMDKGFSSSTVDVPHTEELAEGYVTVSVTRSPSVESYTTGGGPDSGLVGCRIVRDGEVVDEQTAEGEFATATCSKFY